jgi:hypothetical protein
MPTKPEPGTVYTICVELDGSEPAIWRRFQVTDTMTLGELHRTIQIVMGWTDSHLHGFIIDGRDYSRPDHDLDAVDCQWKNEDQTRLGDILRKKQRFQYVYDYGDDWVHTLRVEKVGKPVPGTRYPVCLEGEGACPLEDCGGIWGYRDLLSALQDPGHPRHQDVMDWTDGDLDPEAFDLDECNEMLARFDEGLPEWGDFEDDERD